MSKRAKTPARVNPETLKVFYGNQRGTIKTTGRYDTRTELESAILQDWQNTILPISWRVLGLRHGVSGSTARNIIIKKRKE